MIINLRYCSRSYIASFKSINKIYDSTSIYYFRRYFATVFSISYALFLTVFGAIVFIGDVVRPKVVGAGSEIFALYLLGVGIAYFVFLMVDIRLHIYKAKSTIKEREKRIREFEEQVARNNVR